MPAFERGDRVYLIDPEAHYTLRDELTGPITGTVENSEPSSISIDGELFYVHFDTPLPTIEWYPHEYGEDDDEEVPQEQHYEIWEGWFHENELAVPPDATQLFKLRRRTLPKRYSNITMEVIPL